MWQFVALVLAVVLAACGSDGDKAATTTTTAATPSTTTSITLSTTLLPSTTANSSVPSTTVPQSRISTVTAADLPSSWRPGCPVGPEQLRRLSVEYWGFDNQSHAGVLIVHATVAEAVVRVFDRLRDEQFPIRRIEPVDVYNGSDEASMDADNTSAFNCRYAVADGPPRWSRHAFGKAIDINPVENPYLQGGKVQPPAGAGFVDRSTYQPGMAVEGGVLVRAFASAGWRWGGRWSGTPDYQHFETG